jgi:hypothetical protein
MIQLSPVKSENPKEKSTPGKPKPAIKPVIQ